MNYTSAHTHCHTHAHSFMLYLGIEYWFHASCETDRDDLKHYVKCWGETAHWFLRRPRQRSQSSSWVEVCSYPSLHSTDINESFHLINLEAERFNADVLSCMMTGSIKLGKKSNHTHTILTVDVGSDYVKAASTAESDHLVHRETGFRVQSGNIKYKFIQQKLVFWNILSVLFCVLLLCVCVLCFVLWFLFCFVLYCY